MTEASQGPSEPFIGQVQFPLFHLCVLFHQLVSVIFYSLAPSLHPLPPYFIPPSPISISIFPILPILSSHLLFSTFSPLPPPIYLAPQIFCSLPVVTAPRLISFLKSHFPSLPIPVPHCLHIVSSMTVSIRPLTRAGRNSLANLLFAAFWCACQHLFLSAVKCSLHFSLFTTPLPNLIFLFPYPPSIHAGSSLNLVKGPLCNS